MTAPLSALDRHFKISQSGSSVGVEIRAGITTFLTMAYILFVNPSILGAAIDVPDVNVFPQILTATAIAAAVGTLMMGLLARYPFALAPGMGLNAYFVSVVMMEKGVTWQIALGAVFISGILFLLLSLFGLREMIVNAIPLDIKIATAAGIGLFLAFIGCENAGFVVDQPFTLVTLGDLHSAGALLAVFGLLITGLLLALKMRGAILIGIVLTAALSIFSGAPVFGEAGNMHAFQGFNEGFIRAPAWPTDLFMKMDVMGALGLGALGVVFTFFFVDLLDTAGTLIGLSQKAGYLDKQGRIPRAQQAFASDAVATSLGAMMGTSTTTSYIESASGIEEGGRTGFTAIVVAALFLLSIFLWPLAGAIPAVSTAPALIIIGAMMISGIGKIDWEDYHVSIPAFLTIIGMPFTYSIANGISFGIISYTVLNLFSGRIRQVHWLMIVLAILLTARYIWLGAS